MRSVRIVCWLGLLCALLMARDATAQAKQYKLENNELVLPTPIVFQPGTDKLAPESDAALDYVREYLNDKSYISLMRVESHTDNSDAEARNDALSRGRAKAIVAALVGKGINCTRLLAVGFGATKPVAPNDTPDNKAKNRRVAFVNAALRGRPIGGMPVDGGGKVANTPCSN